MNGPKFLRHELRCCALFLAYVLVSIWVARSGTVSELATAANEHPRLYFNREDLPRLRQARFQGERRRIWQNLATSADQCLRREPRKEWIAPLATDPRYENLYDRFYAIMGDLAVTEHLAFAYAFSGDDRYGNAVRQWVLASCRVWQKEAEGRPDSGKAYAVSRLLKGVAVGYDVAFDRFTSAERDEIRDTLVRIGRKYFEEWFTLPAITGPDYHTHHAIVEWASFGVLALALLGEAPEAEPWLAATKKKFVQHLLPAGLAEDGAQVEGATFWASTMQYRLFFMDPLRRVTGADFFKRFRGEMNAELALASIACRKRPGLDEHHANVVLEPSYGQLDYYAPILLALAREYRRPIYQQLASWDESLGALQHTRYVTPHGEELLFELGGYAFLWWDDSVAGPLAETKLSWRFPSINEAYLRNSWNPGDWVAAVRQGEIVVHGAGHPLLIELGIKTNTPPITQPLVLTDMGRRAAILIGTNADSFVKLELDRKTSTLTLLRQGMGGWKFWCQDDPHPDGNRIRWKDGTTIVFRAGKLAHWSSEGHQTILSVSNGLLPLKDPAPKSYPVGVVYPDSTGKIFAEFTLPGRPSMP